MFRFCLHIWQFSPKNFTRGQKPQNFEPFFVDPRPDWTATIPKRCNFSKPQHKVVLHRWLGYHVLKLGEDWSPISEISPGVCTPRMCENGKWAIRKLITHWASEFKGVREKVSMFARMRANRQSSECERVLASATKCERVGEFERMQANMWTSECRGVLASVRLPVAIQL